jgi:hypothetical protein
MSQLISPADSADPRRGRTAVKGYLIKAAAFCAIAGGVW